MPSTPTIPPLLLAALLFSSSLLACRTGGAQFKDSERPVDQDGDGFEEDEDCDDLDAEVRPDAVEVCNGIDDDCDSEIDEGVSLWAYPDRDGDGSGAGTAESFCETPEGYAGNNLDCDDADPTVHPGARELCNGIDDDCDGHVEAGKETFFVDADGDGYGDPDSQHEDCGPDEHDVIVADDCDDGDATVHPGADDPCGDDVDSDCDPRDLQCVIGGEYPAEDLDARLRADGSNQGAGEYLDVGDVNGDGYDDVAVSAFYMDSRNGGAYIVYGPVYGDHTLDEVGDRVSSSRSTTSAGRSIALGDLNGDGFDDLGIGAPDSTCRYWVFFGPLSGDTSITSATFTRIGDYGNEAGHGSDIADVDGDGVDDLLVGAYEDDTIGNNAGAVYVEYGPLGPSTSFLIDAADAVLYGESRLAYAGRYVRSGGDVDGDGAADILVAAPYASGGAPKVGAAYLVYGGLRGTLTLSSADAKYLGESASDYAGEGQTLGDLDGDGLDDVVIGSLNSTGGANAGAVYVVYGPGTGVVGLSAAHVILRGDRAQEQFGLGLAVHDIDGDGLGELLVGAKGDNRGEPGGGAAFLYWGPVEGSLGPDDAAAVILGESRGDNLGMDVAFGDLDGNGSRDMIFGAPYSSAGGTSAGMLYVFYVDL
jgi:hypothetical protein